MRLPRGTDFTRREAYDRIETHAATLRQRVYLAIIEAGGSGCTDYELQERLIMPGNTERPRRIELLKQGLIRDSGRTRESSSGRRAVVWIATPGVLRR